jgi:hypothetical protein
VWCGGVVAVRAGGWWGGVGGGWGKGGVGRVGVGVIVDGGCGGGIFVVVGGIVTAGILLARLREVEWSRWTVGGAVAWGGAGGAGMCRDGWWCGCDGPGVGWCGCGWCWPCV